MKRSKAKFKRWYRCVQCSTILLLVAAPSAWSLDSGFPGSGQPEGTCTPITSTQAPLQTLRFTGSDADRMNWLSDLLNTFLDPSRHDGGNVLHGNSSLLYSDFQARGNLPLGTIGSTDLVGGLNFLLRTAPLEDDGYVWSSGQSPFWPFPNADHSNGSLPAWRFDGSTTEGWTSSGFSSSAVAGGVWSLAMTGSDPQLISPSFSKPASSIPFIYLTMLCQDGSAYCSPPSGQGFNEGQIFWKTDVDPNFSESKSMKFRLAHPDEHITGFPFLPLSHAIPVYQSSAWTNTIIGIRIDPVLSGQPGRTLTVGQIEAAYDARQQLTSPIYILAVAQYYFATGDPVIFTSDFPPHGTAFDRARKAMNFIESEPFGLHGRANDYTLVDWKGHDGRAGIVGTTIQYGKGILGSVYDALPVGYKDAYASVYYYAALKALAQLEAEAAAHPEWGVDANPYSQNAASYESQAAEVKTAIANQFWLTGKGRLMACQDADSVNQDPGHVGLNLEAAYFDAISEAQVAEMLDWLSGDRTVSGDLSTGSDIYYWQATPRVTTKSVSAWYTWPMYVWFGVDLNAFPGADFGEQVQNGGGWFWQSFYDVVARVKYRDPDDGWNRLKAIIDWYKEVQSEGGVACYYENRGIVKQGCVGAGAIGIDCEFVESTLVPLSALYGFLGYETGRDGLIFHPRVPVDSPRMGVERLFFRDHYYNVEARQDLSTPLLVRTFAGSTAHTLPLRVDGLLASHSYQVRITNLVNGSVTTTVQTSDSNGTLKGSFSLPANGKLEIVTNSELFSDGFESGNTSRWDT